MSILFRTAARTLQLQPDIAVHGDASQSGALELEISDVPARRRQWLAGLSDFLLRGLEDLQEENPKAITVRVSEGER